MPNPTRRTTPATRRRGQPFELRRSSIQGLGAFATRTIRRGARIIEYTGERVSHEVASERYDDDSMERHHTFLFTVDDDTVIDAAVGGNDARFINHSCAPNCESVDVDGRIYIEALRTIRPGEELTYDYRYERDGEYDERWEELYACRCGAPTCRGTILAPIVEKKAKARARAKAKKQRATKPTKRTQRARPSAKPKQPAVKRGRR